jgi:hypothetical protein
MFGVLWIEKRRAQKLNREKRKIDFLCEFFMQFPIYRSAGVMRKRANLSSFKLYSFVLFCSEKRERKNFFPSFLPSSRFAE